MINFLSLEFLFGIIIGCLIVMAIYQFAKKNNDNASLETKIIAIKTLLDEIKTSENQRTGSINTTLTDIKTASQEISQRSHEIKNTLISGPGQRQGAWGQMVLEFILGKLGFTEGQEFHTQVSMKTDDGTTKIPDVIVHFPDKDGQRDVVIDSKVSLTAWDEYVNSDDENIKEDALKRHKKSIKDHIDSLTKKNYQKELGINSLDGVIMFCPNEAAISSLGNSSRLMMEYAIQKKITLNVENLEILIPLSSQQGELTITILEQSTLRFGCTGTWSNERFSSISSQYLLRGTGQNRGLPIATETRRHFKRSENVHRFRGT